MRRWLLGGALVALLILTALATTSGGDAGPQGTLAMRRLLTEMGRTVIEGEGVRAPPATAVILADARGDEEAGVLLDWVRAGGTLVLADPSSLIAGRLGVVPVASPSYVGGTRALVVGCAHPLVAGARDVVVHRREPGLRVADARAIACFPTPDGGAFAVIVPHGEGTVVALAGPSPLTNELLADADNAMLALALMRGTVSFEPAQPLERGRGGFWGTLPGPARAVLLGLALSVALFATAHGRRFGRVPVERPASPIPASELVRAAAGLYRQARAAGYAGEVMREAAVDRIAARLGAPPTVERDTLVEPVAHASGYPIERVRRALAGPEPGTDAELIALGRELEEIRRRIEGARS